MYPAFKKRSNKVAKRLGLTKNKPYIYILLIKTQSGYAKREKCKRTIRKRNVF
jgi:hypothetical protein